MPITTLSICAAGDPPRRAHRSTHPAVLHQGGPGHLLGACLGPSGGRTSWAQACSHNRRAAQGGASTCCSSSAAAQRQTGALCAGGHRSLACVHDSASSGNSHGIHAFAAALRKRHPQWHMHGRAFTGYGLAGVVVPLTSEPVLGPGTVTLSAQTAGWGCQAGPGPGCCDA